MSRRLSLLATLLVMPHVSWGLIVFESKTSTNNSYNTSAPSNGAPWANVAQQQVLVSGNLTIDSGAVYLGNGFLLTAAHTNTPTSVILDGVPYSRDTSFPAISMAPYDLRLYKILGPPSAPSLIPLPDSSDTDTNTASTLIGWGKGKGAIVTNQGWQWGDNSTRTKRWGTNVTAPSTYALSYWSTYSYNATYVTLTPSGTIGSTGVTEACATDGDSGGGLFQQFSGTWKLSGILTLVYSSAGNSTYYSPSDACFAVRTADVASQLRYRQWKAAEGIALSASTEEDSDGDGLGLLEEYAFGTDPAVDSSAASPEIAVDGTDATITYQLQRTRTDLVIEIQESTDLSIWTAANVTTTSTVSDNGTIRTYKASVPLDGAEKKFLRLHFTALTN